MGRITVTALVFLLLAAPIAFADTLTGKVVKVADDDSITVLDNTNTASGCKALTPQNENKPSAMPQGSIWQVWSQARQ